MFFINDKPFFAPENNQNLVGFLLIFSGVGVLFERDLCNFYRSGIYSVNALFMAKNIQIKVADPCGQNWEGMKEVKDGRYCASCQKTVVDFTTMSDRELLSWLAGAGKNVCGRLSPDQVNRDLLPVRERKAGWKGAWNFLLASLLVAVRVQAQPKMGKVAISQTDKRMTLATVDSAGPSTDTRVPKFDILPPVTILGYETCKYPNLMGCVIFISDQTHTLRDTLTAWVADTLAQMGIKGQEIKLYPDPAPRGTAVRLSLQFRQPGEYQVGLFNAAGALVQARSIEWADKSQIELLNIPASLTGGVYFVRVSGAGMEKTYTRKLVVL